MEQAGLVDVQIHWIPIMPGRFSALQPAAESAVSGMLLRHIPGLGALLSHSCMLTGTKPSISS
jgi:hypothetical protein